VWPPGGGRAAPARGATPRGSRSLARASRGHGRRSGGRGQVPQGLLDRARRGGRARRPGRRARQRRQHRRRHGGRAVPVRASGGCRPAGDSGSRPGARAAPADPARRRRHRRLLARVDRAVRPHGQRVRPHPPRRRRAAGRPAVERRGARQGRRPAQEGARPPEPCPVSWGNVEGATSERPCRRGGHRRLHGNVDLKTLEGRCPVRRGPRLFVSSGPTRRRGRGVVRRSCSGPPSDLDPDPRWRAAARVRGVASSPTARRRPGRSSTRSPLPPSASGSGPWNGRRSGGRCRQRRTSCGVRSSTPRCSPWCRRGGRECRPRRRPRCRRGGARSAWELARGRLRHADLLEEDLGEGMVGFPPRRRRPRRAAHRRKRPTTWPPFGAGGGRPRRRPRRRRPPGPPARRDSTTRSRRWRALVTASPTPSYCLRPLAPVELLGERGRRVQQRLEFLATPSWGWSSHAAYRRFPDAGGELAKLRSRVNTATLARSRPRSGSDRPAARKARRRRVGGPRPPSSPTPWKP